MAASTGPSRSWCFPLSRTDVAEFGAVGSGRSREKLDCSGGYRLALHGKTTFKPGWGGVFASAPFETTIASSLRRMRMIFTDGQDMIRRQREKEERQMMAKIIRI